MFVLYCITLCSFSFCHHLEVEEKAGVALLFLSDRCCYYKCSVALPHGAVGWSAVCGISLIFSLTF